MVIDAIRNTHSENYPGGYRGFVLEMGRSRGELTPKSKGIGSLQEIVQRIRIAVK